MGRQPEGIRQHSVTGIILAMMLFLLLPACQATPKVKRVTVLVDGKSLEVSTQAPTVRALLQELDIVLGDLDRIEPDLWWETTDGGIVTITRVNVLEESERRQIPFQQKTIRSEAIAPGDRKLLQLGSAGLEEIVYRVIFEDGIQVDRREVLRTVLRPPIDEIISVGIQSDLPPIPISGVVAYISGGNAWMMRGSSGSRRPLTSSGDLDGRVFSLSSNGDWLLYSRVEPDMPPDVLNRLWLVGTGVLNEEPQPLRIEGAVYADWMSDSRRFIYSTAERTGASPGWRARNDLWRAELHGLKPAGQRTGREVITASVTSLVTSLPGELYDWWGTNFALAPDDSHVAYGRPNGVGVLDLRTKRDAMLVEFAAYHTYGEWVWLPELTWSPDGQFIACTTHGITAGVKPEDSQAFHVTIMDRIGRLQVTAAPEAGMWAAPVWSPSTSDGKGASAIAFGVARIPNDSQNSRYDLFLMDRDGSNQRRVFPPAGQEGLVAPDLAWSPDGRSMIVAHEGNLFLVDAVNGEWRQITGDGHSGQPTWSRD